MGQGIQVAMETTNFGSQILRFTTNRASRIADAAAGFCTQCTKLCLQTDQHASNDDKARTQEDPANAKRSPI